MKVTKIFICEDCTVAFQVYGMTKRKGYFCPACGETIAVTPYQSDRLCSAVTKISWKPEELELVKQCINGKMQPYQVAILIGRSTNAVSKKAQRMKAMYHIDSEMR